VLGLDVVMSLGFVGLGCRIARRFRTSGPASAGAARGRGWSATSGRRARRPSASVYHAPALVRWDFSDLISLHVQYCSC
jgi:hypothetical protein